MVNATCSSLKICFFVMLYFEHFTLILQYTKFNTCICFSEKVSGHFKLWNVLFRLFCFVCVYFFYSFLCFSSSTTIQFTCVKFKCLYVYVWVTRKSEKSFNFFLSFKVYGIFENSSVECWKLQNSLNLILQFFFFSLLKFT